jgi:F0F1-type ATP synthase delta subunit
LFELKIGSDSGPIDTESWLDFCLNNQQLRTLEINRDYEKIKTFQTIVENFPNLRFLIWQACFRKKAKEEKAIKLIGKNCKNLKFLVMVLCFKKRDDIIAPLKEKISDLKGLVIVKNGETGAFEDFLFD